MSDAALSWSDRLTDMCTTVPLKEIAKIFALLLKEEKCIGFQRNLGYNPNTYAQDFTSTYRMGNIFRILSVA